MKLECEFFEIKLFAVFFIFSYGFVTNTKIKFILVIDSGNIALRENEVRAVSGKLFILYFYFSLRKS